MVPRFLLPLMPVSWVAARAVCAPRASRGADTMSTPSRVNAPSSMQLDGRELPLWPYDHLCSVEKKALATKALDLRERIKAVPLLHAKHAAALRTGGDITLTLRWVLQVQADLLTARGRSEVFRSPGAHRRGGSSRRKVRPGDAPDAAQMAFLPCGPRALATLSPHPSFRRQGSGRPTSIQDFGHPVDASAGACAVMDMRDLPSIKKTKDAITTEVAAFKKGPGMHDSGGEKSDVFK